MTRDPFTQDPATLLRALDFSAELAARNEQHQGQLRHLFLALLEVMDAFDRLLGEAASTSVTGGSLRPVQLIARQLERALGQTGVVPIDGRGQVADPRRHEIAEVRDTREVGDDVILEVLRRGWEWEGSLLRPARVIVARHEPASLELKEEIKP